MAFKSYFVVLLSLLVMAGCQAKVGILRNIPAAQQQAVLAGLTTGSYAVHQCPGVVIIEPKNRDAALAIIGPGCHTLEGEGHDVDGVHLYPEIGLREIVDPNGQVLGFVSYDQQRVKVGVGMGDNGTARLYISRRYSGR